MSPAYRGASGRVHTTRPLAAPQVSLWQGTTRVASFYGLTEAKHRARVIAGVTGKGVWIHAAWTDRVWWCNPETMTVEER